MAWIKEGTALEGKYVKLLPLEEAHFDELFELSKDQRIWEFYPRDMSTKEKVIVAMQGGIDERMQGTQYPFVIWHKQQQRLIGSTRLMDIVQPHRKLEIGWTWLHPEYWATVINFDCKLTLLRFCFEELDALRVQLKTDEHNMRSRTAIAKIGATYEGILRNDMVRENGTSRHTAYFSIIASEWEVVKLGLEDKLAGFQQA